MDDLSIEVQDDSQGWRSASWRWKVVSRAGDTVASADRDYLTRSEAHLAASEAMHRLVQLQTGNEQPECKTDYTQYWRNGDTVKDEK